MEKESQSLSTPIDHVADWDNAMRSGLKAERIHDPHLIQKAEEYAKKLGVKTPLLYVAEEFPPILGGKMPNALAHVGDAHIPSAIAFTRQQFEMHNYRPGSGMIPPNEVLSALGHEMGHIKQGKSYLDGVRKYPKLAGLGAMVAGVYLLDKAFEHRKKQQKDNLLSDDNLQSSLQEVTQVEREKIKKLMSKASDSHKLHGPLAIIESTLNATLKAGEYMAAAATGLIGGRFVTRQFMLNAEFDADKVGAELCGDPRASIRDLLSGRKYMHANMEEMKKLAKQITPADQLSAYFEHAHPTLKERIERLEAMARRMEKAAANTMHNAQAAIGSVIENAPVALRQIEHVVIKSHPHL